MSNQLAATDAAIAVIERLKERNGDLMFIQSGGCCDGSSPICLRDGEFLIGSGDLLLGYLSGCPFYIDREQYERWNRPVFLIDISQGDGDTFSLEGPDGIHFIARS